MYAALLIVGIISFIVEIQSSTVSANGATRDVSLSNDAFGSNVTAGFLEGGMPGTKVPNRFVIHLNNATVPSPAPSGTIDINVTTESFSNYLKSNNVNVYFEYPKLGGLAIELPEKMPLQILGPIPSNTTALANRDTTLLDVLKIFGSALPSNATAEGESLLRSASNDTEVCQIIMLHPNVNSCKPDVVGAPSGQTVSTGLKRIHSYGYPSTGLDYGNADLVIAIVDTGISLHSDINVIERVTFVGNKEDDNSGHGTHVAGIVGAKDNSFGVLGVAPNAKLISLKVLDPCGPNCWVGGTSTFEAAAEYILDHSDDIHLANWSVDLVTQRDPELDALINEAVANNVTSVVAAGNFNRDASKSSPPSASEAITVSAISDTDGRCGGLGPPINLIERDDTFYSRSNFGSLIDIAAPGVMINSTSIGNSYSEKSGTSMAAPFVTGAAAVYLVRHPGETPFQILEALQNSAATVEMLCNNSGHGYLLNRNHDHDEFPEPLLYITDLHAHLFPQKFD